MGGLYALGMRGAPDVSVKNKYWQNAADLTSTCHKSYTNSPSGLGPEEMVFKAGQELTSSNSKGRYYILRPETIESYFYLWRESHDPKYREWAWEAAQAIERNAKCGTFGGYCGVKDVNKVPPTFDNIQQSFFLAETLKYIHSLPCYIHSLPCYIHSLPCYTHSLPCYTHSLPCFTMAPNILI